MSVQMRKFRALDRRRRVAALYAQGRGQKEIAELLGVQQGTISRDLDVVREEWKGAVRRDYEEACGRETQKLELLEELSWEIWDREVSKEENGGPSNEEQDPKRMNKSRWKCLELIIRCIGQRRRLLGLELPARRREGIGNIVEQVREKEKTKREEAGSPKMGSGK